MSSSIKSISDDVSFSTTSGNSYYWIIKRAKTALKKYTPGKRLLSVFALRHNPLRHHSSYTSWKIKFYPHGDNINGNLRPTILIGTPGKENLQRQMRIHIEGSDYNFVDQMRTFNSESGYRFYLPSTNADLFDYILQIDKLIVQLFTWFFFGESFEKLFHQTVSR